MNEINRKKTTIDLGPLSNILLLDQFLIEMSTKKWIKPEIY